MVEGQQTDFHGDEERNQRNDRMRGRDKTRRELELAEKEQNQSMAKNWRGVREGLRCTVHAWGYANYRF